MADELDDDLKDLDPAEKEKLKKLLEKDSKSFRTPDGFWKWVVALLGAAMVLFYFYSAGLKAVATQYHRGVYVFATYVLVFLLYPAGKTRIRVILGLILGAIISCSAAILFFSESATAFHNRLLSFGDAWNEHGLAAIGQLGSLWWLVLASVAIAALLLPADTFSMKRWPQIPAPSDILFAIASGLVVYYWISEFEALNYRAGAETDLDAMISIAGILISLEVCRRVLGWSMTLIGVGMLCYGYFGPHFPEIIAHRGFGIERLATSLYLTTNGVFGVMASVLATYVILFIFFGAFLQKSGAGKFFIDLPLALAGRSTGGPAKVAVIASAIFGSVSGSAIANTVSTGAFTIPLMKRAGFRPHVAGAIEPSASIGGMFLPPVMGAGGFLMAELTETSYATIMMISVFPALLYFFSVFCMIHFEAKKMGIKGLVDEEFPHWKKVLLKDGYFALPLIIITVLMIMGRSPGFSAFWATISCIVISWFRAETRMGIKEIWEAIQVGARNTLVIGATLGVIGVIVGVISLTGIGLKFSDIIISLAGGNLLMALFLVALASLVLGMGVPVTAAYLITAVLAVPPLGDLGVPILAAHMIVYWLSQDSNITPPVCVAAYAGAAIAGSDPWKTGWTAFKYAKLLYVMPVLFAFTPSILFQAKPIDVRMTAIDGDVPFATVVKVNVKEGDEFIKGDLIAKVMVGDEIIDVMANRDGNVSHVLVQGGGLVNAGDPIVTGEVRATKTKVISSFVSAILGTIAFSATTMLFWIRRTTLPEWLMLAAATILLYWPTVVTDTIGLIVVAIVWYLQKTKNKRDLANAAVA
ncbi:TRAP transporter fused permease subunit [Trichloromonas sp.]|uniref:TRAP transporter fused permease subunit n=1 Tax=Trichloromonas sp. TaxID=3069249 RepID=UPI003D817917